MTPAKLYHAQNPSDPSMAQQNVMYPDQSIFNRQMLNGFSMKSEMANPLSKINNHYSYNGYISTIDTTAEFHVQQANTTFYDHRKNNFESVSHKNKSSFYYELTNEF